MPVIVDRAAAVLSDFVSGANKPDFHTTGVNWERDASITEIADIRNVVAGDPSQMDKVLYKSRRGIEVGHIFQLGDKYAKALNCAVMGEQGKPVITMMGCYGIGVTRIVAAAIEQNHDDNGIIWKTTSTGESLAPFTVAVVPMIKGKMKDALDPARGQSNATCRSALHWAKSPRCWCATWWPRRARRVKFADLELVGIPIELLSQRKISVKTGEVKYEYVNP